MALLNTAISNLLGGVSQQADALRGGSNCRVQTNAYPSPVSGLVKRPPTQFMTDAMGALFTGANTSDPYTHVINRDSTERYLVTVADVNVAVNADVAPISVWDLENNVDVPVFFDLKAHTYLNNGSAARGFSMCTTGDVTFIANKNRRMTKGGTLSGANTGMGLVHVRQGAYDTEYRIKIDGTTVSHETHKTAENAAQTTDIAERLLVALNGGATTEATDSTIELGTDGTSDISAGTSHPTVGYFGYSNALRIAVDFGIAGNPNLLGKIVTFDDVQVTDFDYIAEVLSGPYGRQTRSLITFPIQKGDQFKIIAHDAAHTWIELGLIGNVYNEVVFIAPARGGNAERQTMTVNYSVSSVFSGFTFIRNDSTISILKDNGADFNLEATDDVGDTYIKAFKGTTQYFADLPASSYNGFQIKIGGHVESDIDDYYVAFSTHSGETYGDGSWSETIGPLVVTNLTAFSSMPRILIRQADGTFFFKRADGTTLPSSVSAGIPFMTDDDTDDEGTIGASGWYLYGIGKSKIAVEGLIPNSVVPVGTTVAITDSDGYKREYTTSGGQTVSSEGKQTLILTTDTAITVTETDLVELYYLGAGPPTRYNQYQWQDRAVGDETTNPAPGFVDKFPSDIFFYENRLGILAGETITLSESGEFFNFFRTTVIDLLDTAPIEVTGSSRTVNILRHAVPFNGNLLLWGDNTQFMLGSGNTGLSPKTVAMTQVSNYECDPDCAPQVSGNSVFFAYKRGAYGGVQEMVISDPEAKVVTAYDITDPVPSYIENPLRMLASMPQEKLVIGLPLAEGSDMQSLYLYKYLDRGNERIQSAWFKFDLTDYGVVTGATQIVGIHVIENVLYVVTRLRDTATQANSLTSIHKIEFTTEGLADLFSIPPLLDNCVSYLGTGETATGDEDVTAVYDGSIETTFTLPFGSEGKTIADFKIISKWQSSDDAGDELTITSGTFSVAGETKLVVAGDHTADHLWFGNIYTMTYQYASPLFKGPSSGGGMSLVTAGRFQIHSADIVFHETHEFDVAVVVEGRGSYSYAYLADSAQVNVTVEGGAGFGDGNIRIPVHAKNDTYSMTITSDSPYPVKLLSTEFEAQYNSRSQRAGI